MRALSLSAVLVIVVVAGTIRGDDDPPPKQLNFHVKLFLSQGDPLVVPHIFEPALAIWQGSHILR